MFSKVVSILRPSKAFNPAIEETVSTVFFHSIGVPVLYGLGRILAEVRYSSSLIMKSLTDHSCRAARNAPLVCSSVCHIVLLLAPFPSRLNI